MWLFQVARHDDSESSSGSTCKQAPCSWFTHTLTHCAGRRPSQAVDAVRRMACDTAPRQTVAGCPPGCAGRLPARVRDAGREHSGANRGLRLRRGPAGAVCYSHAPVQTLDAGAVAPASPGSGGELTTDAMLLLICASETPRAGPGTVCCGVKGPTAVHAAVTAAKYNTADAALPSVMLWLQPAVKFGHVVVQSASGSPPQRGVLDSSCSAATIDRLLDQFQAVSYTQSLPAHQCSLTLLLAEDGRYHAPGCCSCAAICMSTSCCSTACCWLLVAQALLAAAG
jgi:hypothetical protein